MANTVQGLMSCGPAGGTCCLNNLKLLQQALHVLTASHVAHAMQSAAGRLSASCHYHSFALAAVPALHSKCRQVIGDLQQSGKSK